jgi:hypothetical protein
VAVLALLVAPAGCGSGGEEAPVCGTDGDCARGTICADGRCREGCRDDGDCAAGYCVASACVVRPPERCDCQPSSACTATAAECRVDRPERPCITDAHCDDGNSCSVDTCVAGGCVWRAAAGVLCCAESAQCDDGDPCTVDRCDTFRCQNARRPGCCTTAADCDDGDPCTPQSCKDGLCDIGLPDPGCCRTDRDCVDGDPCTADLCLRGICAHPVTGSASACPCAGTGDCDDGNPCTLDRCLSGTCSYAPSGRPGDPPDLVCCAGSATCPPSGAEDVLSVCRWSVCVFEPLAPCAGEEDCDDRDACTVETCLGGYCDHTPVGASNCCNTDADCADRGACATATCTFNRCGYRPKLEEGCCADAIECNDGLACTVDECASFTCVYRPAGPGCCLTDADCDDGNACTADRCAADRSCRYEPGACPCVDNGDCDDGQPCTDDRCEANQCRNVALPACCTSAAECADGDPCTSESCVQNRCVIAQDPACCTTAAYCWDGDPCTTESCVEGQCVFTPREPCCRSDADCLPADPCLLGRCVAGDCRTEPRSACCHADADCDDGDDVCTTDRCIDNACVYASTGVPGCCLVHADCASADPCQAGACRADGLCVFADVAGCCRADAGCDDGDYCTTDTCTADHRCAHAPSGAEGCCEAFDYLVGFDGAGHGWTLENSDSEVGWQVDGHRVYGGTASLYYGDPPWYHYDTTPALASRGTATSPELTLPAGQPYRLRLHLLVDVRASLAVDRLQVRILEPDGTLTIVWTRDALAAVGGTTGGAFVPVVLALDAFTGRTIRLQLSFDTVDVPASEVAGLEGIYLDSLSLVAACAP